VAGEERVHETPTGGARRVGTAADHAVEVRNALQQEQPARPDPTRDPGCDRVRGQPEAPLEPGARCPSPVGASGEAAGEKDRQAAAPRHLARGGERADRFRARDVMSQDVRILIHREERHLVRAGLRETQAAHLVTHLVGEETAPRHDEDSTPARRRRERPHDRPQSASGASETTADLDDQVPVSRAGRRHARLTPFPRRP
jgi:hypothetical protein